MRKRPWTRTLRFVSREPRLMLNLSRHDVVCEHLTVADLPLRRLRGLLGRSSLPVGEGLLLAPAPSIHTAFMRFPIDVVFMDGTLGVLKVVQGLAPWRAASAHRARAVLELPAGEVERRRIAVGDQLGVIEVEAYPTAVLTRVGGRGRARIGAQVAEPAVDTSAVAGSPVPSSRAAAGADSGTRVLLVSGDRRFRSTAAALLTRRGCTVAVGDPTESVTELTRAGRTDVVILDAGHSALAAAHQAAEVEALRPSVGLVLVVGDEAEQVLSRVPMHTRWESFDRLYAAIERARRAAMKVA